MIPLSISLRANPGTGIVVSEEGFTLKMRKSAGLSVGQGLLCRCTVANNFNELPRQLWNAGQHVGSSQRRTSDQHLRGCRERIEQRGSFAINTMKTSANPMMCPRPNVPQSCSKSWPFSLPSDSSNEALSPLLEALGGSELNTERILSQDVGS